jgi:hypothetical protein
MMILLMLFRQNGLVNSSTEIVPCRLHFVRAGFKPTGLLFDGNFQPTEITMIYRMTWKVDGPTAPQQRHEKRRILRQWLSRRGCFQQISLNIEKLQM